MLCLLVAANEKCAHDEHAPCPETEPPPVPPEILVSSQEMAFLSGSSTGSKPWGPFRGWGGLYSMISGLCVRQPERLAVGGQRSGQNQLWEKPGRGMNVLEPRPFAQRLVGWGQPPLSTKPMIVHYSPAGGPAWGPASSCFLRPVSSLASSWGLLQPALVGPWVVNQYISSLTALLLNTILLLPSF